MSNQRIELTHETAEQMSGAIAELAKLSQTSIVTQESDAKKAGLSQFLNRTLMAHANELVACWFAVRNEYEPLINGFAGLMARSGAILEQRNQLRLAQQEAQQSKTEDPAPGK